MFDEKKKVEVSIWDMSSDPGYRPSHGEGFAILVPDLSFGTRTGEALYEWGVAYLKAHPNCLIGEDMLTSPVHWEKHPGVCNYRGVRGLFSPPEKMAVLQLEMEDVSTCDRVFRRAKVLNPLEVDFDNLRNALVRRVELATLETVLFLGRYFHEI